MNPSQEGRCACRVCATRGVHQRTRLRSVSSRVPDLIAAIEDHIANHNTDPKPFVWTKTADEIIETVRRGRVALEQVRVN